MIERILSWFGIYKCHFCEKYIYPWQDFYGYINMPMIPDGKTHLLVAKWVTHAGECTERDIKGNRGK